MKEIKYLGQIIEKDSRRLDSGQLSAIKKAYQTVKM